MEIYKLTFYINIGFGEHEVLKMPWANSLSKEFFDLYKGITRINIQKAEKIENIDINNMGYIDGGDDQ